MDKSDVVTLDYKYLVHLLIKSTVIKLTILEKPEKFRRKLAMAKHRSGVEGKLDFDSKELDEDYMERHYGQRVIGHDITVVLRPSLKPSAVAGSITGVGL